MLARIVLALLLYVGAVAVSIIAASHDAYAFGVPSEVGPGTDTPTVIVELKASPLYDENTRLDDLSLEAQQVAAVAAAVESFRGVVADALGVKASNLSSRQFRSSTLYPYVAVLGTPEVLNAISGYSGAISVFEERAIAQSFLQQTAQQIGVPNALSVGASGAGQLVAVIDTGIDRSHPFLGGTTRLVAEGCFGTSFNPSIPTACSGGFMYGSEAAGSGGPCPLSDCGHGTHVAGVAVGSGVATGAAPQAGIVSIQAWTIPFSGPRTLLFLDLVASLEYVRRLKLGLDAQGNLTRPPLPIAAVNMSFGNPPQLRAQCNYTGSGDDTALRGAIEALSLAGVAVVAATGNSAFKSGLSPPACYPNVIDVSAVTKQGTDAAYSNSDTSTDLAAPGGLNGSIPPSACPISGQIDAICSSAIGGGFEGRNGTSMAAPHVAGAIASIRSRFPSATVAQIRDLLRSTGVSTPVGSYSLPRLNLARALQQAAAPVSSGIVPTSCSTTIVAWSPTPNMLPNSFEVQTALNASFSPLLSNSVVSGTLTQTTTSGPSDVTVYARVRACLSGSPGVCSDWSTPVQTYVGCPPPPATVTADPPDCAGNVGGASWNAVAGVTHYQVEERGPPFSFSGVATSGNLQAPRFDKTLNPPDPLGGDVRIRVRSCIGASCGAWTTSSVLLQWGGDQCG